MRRIRIGRRWVGEGEPAYLVAEVSANHNQSFKRAEEIIRAAKAAGADAVKVQTYTPDTLTIDSDSEWFRVREGSLWAGKTLYQLYAEAFTPWEWHADLQRTAHELGLDFFSTPFDSTAVEFLERMNVPAHKVASFEIVDLPLLRTIAKTGKPVILSTGMASLGEITEAVSTLRQYGTAQIALLKCTSSYPAPFQEVNLRTIPHLGETFDAVAGLSDHTMGGCVAVAAVALGASLIEKHFTLARDAGGPDSAFSMEPAEYAVMVKDIRNIESALGRVSYERTPAESKSLCFRRSLFIVEDVKKGEHFTTSNIRIIRPGYGLEPRYLDHILGKPASSDIPRGTPLTWDCVEGKADA